MDLPMTDECSLHPKSVGGSAVRIVHACNFHYNRNGDKYDTMDARLHHGLVENHHYVYPFPVHDISRQSTWTNSKRFGAKAANQALLETCKKVRPELLVLGHSQSITNECLAKIRDCLPEIKIAMWFCDWFASSRAFKFEFIHQRAPLLDAFFATTAGEKLSVFESGSCRTAFLPNPIHAALDRGKAFTCNEHVHDLIFFGTDRKDPERRETLEKIARNLPSDFSFGVYGSMGQPAVYGSKKDSLMSRSRAGLNLSRLPEPMPWYSSDRIASLMGNGLLCCTRAEAQLGSLYGPDCLFEYTNEAHLIEVLPELIASGEWRSVAERGWETSHREFSAKRVASFLVEFSLDPLLVPRWLWAESPTPS